MKKLIFVILINFLTSVLYAQLEADGDVLLCGNGTVVLTANYQPQSIGTSDYTLEEIPLNMDPQNTGTDLTGLTDDIFSGVIDIGFDFCFYGNVYNQLLISTNNYVTFDLTEANGYSPWNTYAIPSAFPPGQVLDAIMGPWMDLNPNNGGNLYYNVYGIAPFRRFVVSFEDFGYYGSDCVGLQYSGQIKLFETTNVIEVHIQNQPLCTGWNNGESVLGIVNEDETQFLIAPGWNNTQMTANSQGYRFVPSGSGIANLTWTDANGDTVGFGNQVSVSPLSTTTYTVTAQECPNDLSDNVTVTVSPPITIQEIVDDNLCPGEFWGSIEITTSGGTLPYSYSWTSQSGLFNSNNEDIYNLNPDTYFLTIEDQVGCETSFGPYQISPIVLPIEIQANITNPSCEGFDDGSVVVTVTGGTPIYTYTWTSDNPIVGNGTPFLSNLLAGSYHLLLTDNNNCLDSALFELIDETPISISANKSNYNGYNVSCYGKNDAWISCQPSGGRPPYYYIWTNVANDTIYRHSDLHNIGAGNYTLKATDANGCPLISTFEILEPDSLSVMVSNYSHKSCTYNDDGFIEVESTGGPDVPIHSQNYLPHSYIWRASNSFYAEGNSIYNLTNNSYTLTVEDENHCQKDMIFTIEQPPYVIADYYVMNDTVTVNYPYINIYDNSSGNIIDWQWELSNGFYYESQNILNLNLSTNLDSIGTKYYDLKLVVTDEFMCKDSIYGRLAIKDEHTLFVPTSFTPDNDGNNDIFKVFHHAMKPETFSIKIFDRFGSVIFQTNNPNVEWDGKNMFTSNEVMTGVYTYVLKYQDFENRIYDHTNCENCSGTITLIR